MAEPWERYMDADVTWMLLTKRQKVERILSQLRKLLNASEDDFASVRILTSCLIGPDVPPVSPLKPFGEAITEAPHPRFQNRDTDIVGNGLYKPRQEGEAYQGPVPDELRNRDDESKK